MGILSRIILRRPSLANLNDYQDDKQDYLKRIDDLETDARISIWEEGFLISIRQRLERGRDLTDDQILKLEEIEKEVEEREYYG
jgi:hypothetical protein